MGVRARIEGLVLPATAAVLAFGVVGHGGFQPERAYMMAGATILIAVASGSLAFRAHPLPTAAFATLAAGVLSGMLSDGWRSDWALPLALIVIGAVSFFSTRMILSRGELVDLLQAVTWIGAVAGLLGIVGLGFRLEPWVGFATGLWRVASTMSYANAAGALFALCLPAALLLLYGRSTMSRRGAVFLIAAALVLTLSRGALLAATMVVPVVALLGGWPVIRNGLRPLAGAALVGILAIPTITSETTRPVPLLAALLIGAAVTFLPAREARGAGGRNRRIALGVTVAAVAVVGVLMFARGSGLDRLMASRADLAGEGRLRNWGAQLEESLNAPLLGNGFRIYGPHEADRFAHNEYLQVFHDTGAVGLASILVALALLIVAAMRGRSRGDSPRALWAVAIGACGLFAIHSGLDFLWRYPALIALAFMWLAIAAPRAAEEGGPA